MRETKLLPLKGRSGGPGRWRWGQGSGDQNSLRCRTSFGDKAPHVTMSSPLPRPDAQTGPPHPKARCAED